MCDQREQLIGYLYGESDPDQRRRVEAHLGECPGCRAEINGLRAVRDDLLAWNVPEPEPIWRPVAPAPVVVAPRRVPAWALAAAASVLFTVGLAGGMVVRGGWPAAVPAAQETLATAAAPPTAAVPAVAPEDLAQLEAKILARLSSELDRKVQAATAASNAAPVMAASPSVNTEELARRVAILEGWRDDQISLNALFNGNFGRLNSRTASLSQELEMSMLRQVGLESSPR
jgi:anti-sigma factor RsiW